MRTAAMTPAVPAAGAPVAARRGEPGLPGLLGLGLVAAALFSVTFVLNRAMSLAGGPWVWTAALRYVDTAVILSGWILLRRGPGALAAIGRLFLRRARLWLTAGGVGFGVFYLGICYAAGHAPGWVVAATWQVTILATPLVLRGFGSRVPRHGVLFAAVILLGIVLVNLHALAGAAGVARTLMSGLPVLVAAFAYPFGNQLLNRARHYGHDPERVLADPAACVLLMTLGSLPVFLGAVLLAAPPPPTAGQWVSTAVVALVAGCGATTLFLHARNSTADPYRIAAVDATQAGEVGFALLGEVALLGAALPDIAGWLGLVAVTAGLIGFAVRPGQPRAG